MRRCFALADFDSSKVLLRMTRVFGSEVLSFCLTKDVYRRSTYSVSPVLDAQLAHEKRAERADFFDVDTARAAHSA